MEPSARTSVTPQCQPLGDTLVASAQARFFPAWWSYIGTKRQSPPLYRVVVTSRADLELAKAVEPDVVDADYVLVDSLEN